MAESDFLLDIINNKRQYSTFLFLRPKMFSF